MRTIVTLLASLALTQAGELHQVARVCDADRMQQLLSRRPALNETDKNGAAKAAAAKPVAKPVTRPATVLLITSEKLAKSWQPFADLNSD